MFRNHTVEFKPKNAKLCPIDEVELFMQYLKHFLKIKISNICS